MEAGSPYLNLPKRTEAEVKAKRAPSDWALGRVDRNYNYFPYPDQPADDETEAKSC